MGRRPGEFSGICAHEGKLYAAPNMSNNLLVYDPETGEVEGIDVTAVASGNLKFSGICAHEGKLYAAPRTSDKLLICRMSV